MTHCSVSPKKLVTKRVQILVRSYVYLSFIVSTGGSTKPLKTITSSPISFSALRIRGTPGCPHVTCPVDVTVLIMQRGINF